MSTKKKEDPKWKGFSVSEKDINRLSSIFPAYSNLSERAKNAFVYSITTTMDFYPHKTKWSANERNVLRLLWNKCNHDIITDTFQCSYQSMLGQAEVLGLYSQELDRKPLDETDGELMLKALDSGKFSPKEVAIKYDIPYDHHETHMVPVSIKEMFQDELFNGEDK